MPEPSDPTQALDHLIAAARERADEVTTRVRPLLAEKAQVDAQLEALLQARALYSESGSDGPQPETFQRKGSVRAEVQTHVQEILRAAEPDPLHILEVHRRYISRGWTVPGAGEAANITAHLSNSPMFHSPKRGYWALGAGNPKPEQSNRRSSSKRPSSGRKR